MSRFALRCLFIVLAIMSLGGAQGAVAQVVEAAQLQAQSKITSVTLYRGRASITRAAELELAPGAYDVRFADLPDAIQPQTIQARASGQARVLGVDFHQEHVAAPPKPFADLDARLEQLEREVKEIGEEREIIRAQEEFISAIASRAAAETGKNLGGAGMDLEAARKHIDFVAVERGKLLTSRRELDSKQRELERQLRAARAFRDSLGASPTTTRVAVVSLAVTEQAPMTVLLTYLVSNASWEPAYNLRASLSGSSALLEYDAILTQRTGEDWQDVKLALSTAQPSMAAHPPTLRPWFVELQRTRDERQAAEAGAAPPPADADADGDLTKDKLHAMAANADVAGGGPSVLFELPRPLTVKTNIDKQQRTRIASIDTHPKFVHVAVPALTDAVYIRGDLTNASPYLLLPGPASIFVDHDYVGPTVLPVVPPSGEFQAHFGIDQSVRAMRQLVSKKSESTGLLSGGRRSSYDYRLLIDNGSGKPVAIELWDSYPVSRAEEIQIEVVDMSHPLASDAPYLAQQRPQGMLKWMLHVPAGQTGNDALAVTYGVRINRAKDVEMTPLPE